jgi:hypothetical protein
VCVPTLAWFVGSPRRRPVIIIILPIVILLIRCPTESDTPCRWTWPCCFGGAAFEETNAAAAALAVVVGGAAAPEEDLPVDAAVALRCLRPRFFQPAASPRRSSSPSSVATATKRR